MRLGNSTFEEIVMKSFDKTFFARYVPNEDNIIDVFHRHIFVVLWDVLVWMIC